MVKITQSKVAKGAKSGKKVSLNVPDATPLKTKTIKRDKTPKISRKALDLVAKEVTNGTASKIAKTTKSKVEKVDFSAFEKKYGILSNDVLKAVQGVSKFALENPKLSNQLFQERLPLFLQVACVKIPKGHTKIIRVPLKHTLLTDEDDICIIVSDVKGIKNKDHDQHLEHYEQLFEKKGIKNIKKIMTFHEFRTEYETFELRNRLVDLYDYFLADGKICGKVVGKCGSVFYRKRKIPNPIKLQATKLKEHIEQSLSKTQFQLTGHGDCFTIQFGHTKMLEEELVANVYSLVEGLDKLFPGGFKNIKSLNVYTHRASSIPIYLNLNSPNDVEVPIIDDLEPKPTKMVIGEVTTVQGNVEVHNNGLVRVQRRKKVKKDVQDTTETKDSLRKIIKGKKGPRNKVKVALEVSAKVKQEKKPKIKQENNVTTKVKKEKLDNSKIKQEDVKPIKKIKQENGLPYKPIKKEKVKKGKIVKQTNSPKVKVVPKKKKVQKKSK